MRRDVNSLAFWCLEGARWAGDGWVGGGWVGGWVGGGVGEKLRGKGGKSDMHLFF